MKKKEGNTGLIYAMPCDGPQPQVSNEHVIDSTISGFSLGIDNFSNFNSQPRLSCGFQDVDTILEFVFGV